MLWKETMTPSEQFYTLDRVITVMAVNVYCGFCWFKTDDKYTSSIHLSIYAYLW